MPVVSVGERSGGEEGSKVAVLLVLLLVLVIMSVLVL